MHTGPKLAPLLHMYLDMAFRKPRRYLSNRVITGGIKYLEKTPKKAEGMRPRESEILFFQTLFDIFRDIKSF